MQSVSGNLLPIMSIKSLLVLVLLLIIFTSCKHNKGKEDIFKYVPKEMTKAFIDSIQSVIEIDAGNNFTARPVLKANEFYYDERNYRDSNGDLREYSVIQRWDTGDVITNYFYLENQLIFASKKIFTKNLQEKSSYWFRNDTLYHSNIGGQLTAMSKDSILLKGNKYLSLSGDIGDKSYRKYFGKKKYPPNSVIEIIQDESEGSTKTN